jgi:fructosamine-3-kinase
MLPETLIERLRLHLPGSPEAFAPVSGGCIANGGRLEAGGQSFFLKRGDAEVARTFPGEAAGLEALREATQQTGSRLRIPDVPAVEGPGEDAPGFLLMEWLPSGGTRDESFWEQFGRDLAALHRHTSADGRYGFDRDNFIGRLPQANGWTAMWPAFFREQRLAPQVQRARKNGRWRSGWDGRLDALFARMPELLPGSPPASVLHGDLWSGNFLATPGGPVALFDPAAYYGHRETDLAMTQLFGGFERPFYDAYREAWPMEPGYEERKGVYDLYHLVNHLNHFGAGYAGRVERVLRRFA